jgi:hypothetical protein
MPNVWIFQANPAKYRIFDSLTHEREELWNLNQHSREVRKGDIVLIWIAGPDAGIYAIGTVKTDPNSQSDSQQGIGYWFRRQNGTRIKPRVIVAYKRKMLRHPILKVFLENDPNLWGLSIIRNPRGTNFRVLEDQWAALQQDWL